MLRCKLYQNLTWASPAGSACRTCSWLGFSGSDNGFGLTLTTATTMVRQHRSEALRGGDTV
jgi:hypothetical protein